MTSETPIYTVAIIGAGRIGASFDTPRSDSVLTHAHAFVKNARTKLVALVDPDALKCGEQAKIWGTDFFTNVGEMFERVQPDIVVIATPDTTHAELLGDVLELRPKLIICEKPIANSAGALEAIRNMRPAVPVIINFNRRFDAVVIALQEEFVRGKYGTVLSASAVYSKGALHNGSHMIDLARLFFGEVTSVQTLARVQDWEGEPTVGAYLSFERCAHFYLTAGDERMYSIFELDILTEKGRFRFSDSGMTLTVREVVADPLYEGYRSLGEPRVQATDLANAMENLAEHAVRVLDGTESPRSTLENAIKTQDACFRLLE